MSLKGLNIAFTGTLKVLTREQAECLVKNHGASVKIYIDKQTNYVVVGGDPGKLKMKLVKKHSVPCLNETEFLKLLTSSDEKEFK